MGMQFETRLPTPEEVKDKFPLSITAKLNKERVDEEVHNIFSGKSKKMLLIMGPCSADNRYSVMDYCNRLAVLQERVRDKIIIIPRIYTSKPTLGGDGYKEMIFKPGSDEKVDTFKGILYSRALHHKILTDTGMPTADELMYTEDYRYVDDLLAYVAVGSRSVENHMHRLVSSGVSCPVGMKNPINGDLEVMLDAIECARKKHTFIYRGWQVSTSGNNYAHMVLRGFTDKNNNSYVNYEPDDLVKLYVNSKVRGLKNPSLIIDANHSNSNKNPFEQPRVCKEVMQSAKKYSDVKSMLKGFMIESYIEDGRQKPDGKEYGKSITDACLGWKKSEMLVLELANMI